MSRPWSLTWKKWREAVAGNVTVKRTLSALIWFPTGWYFTQNFYVLKSIKGTSMQPTLNPDTSQWRDVVLFDRYSVKSLHQYERGDVVALRSPTDSKLVVKRIVALAGDRVQTLPPYPDAEVLIPEGYAWLEGDEPFRSEDSNYFGPVPLGLIESKLSYILWPLERMGPLDRPKVTGPKSRSNPAWRRQMAQAEREQWRNSRVTTGK